MSCKAPNLAKLIFMSSVLEQKYTVKPFFKRGKLRKNYRIFLPTYRTIHVRCV